MSELQPGTGAGTLARNSDYRSAVGSLERRDLRGAAKDAAALLRRFPEHADAHALSAAVAAAQKRYAEALRCMDHALRLDPDNAAYLAHRSYALAQLMRYREAKETAGRALALAPVEPDVLGALGSALTQCGDFTGALDCFRRAADSAPDDPGHQYNLGTALRFAGRFEEAEFFFDRSVELRPEDCETYYARSGLRTQTAENNHVAELERLAAQSGRPWRGQSLILYALAKELEDLGEWQRAFGNLQRGARLRRAHMTYDVGRDERKMQQIAEAFPPSRFDGVAGGSASDEPVFILGLPRAGSTLVDRTLASHDAVLSAGELQSFPVELIRLVQQQAGTARTPFDRVLESSLAINHGELGDAYVAATRHITGSTQKFTDKMPLNFLYIGLIALALPNARIVHVRRDPMDACYAMYKTVFKGAYPFTYDLEDLARYYSAYDRLMKHWNACLPGRILNVSYEDMVLRQEQATRELLAFCELEWQERCLSFHQLDTAATTASAVEVRRPIYRSSIGKWQRYRHQLSGLERLLTDWQVISDGG